MTRGWAASAARSLLAGQGRQAFERADRLQGLFGQDDVQRRPQAAQQASVVAVDHAGFGQAEYLIRGELRAAPVGLGGQEGAGGMMERPEGRGVRKKGSSATWRVTCGAVRPRVIVLLAETP